MRGCEGGLFLSFHCSLAVSFLAWPRFPSGFCFILSEKKRKLIGKRGGLSSFPHNATAVAARTRAALQHSTRPSRVSVRPRPCLDSLTA